MTAAVGVDDASGLLCVESLKKIHLFLFSRFTTVVCMNGAVVCTSNAILCFGAVRHMSYASLCYSILVLYIFLDSCQDIHVVTNTTINVHVLPESQTIYPLRKISMPPGRNPPVASVCPYFLFGMQPLLLTALTIILGLYCSALYSRPVGSTSSKVLRG